MFVSTHRYLAPLYDHYEVSSYIKKGRDLPLHNPVYWEGDKSYFAFGMGASSLIGQRRLTRPKSVSKYYDFVTALKNDPNYLYENGEDESNEQS